MLSAGSTLGAARPQTCSKESSTLWTLFIWVVMWVRFTRRRALGYNEDLSGLRLSRARHTFLPKCFMLDHACCLPHERQTGRLAICSVPVPPWVEIAIRAFSGCRAVIGLGWFTSGLCVSLWRSRQGTKRRGNAENGVGGAAWARLCVIISALSCFPRGVRWGCAPQTCAKEPLALWTLFI